MHIFFRRRLTTAFFFGLLLFQWYFETMRYSKGYGILFLENIEFIELNSTLETHIKYQPS